MSDGPTAAVETELSILDAKECFAVPGEDSIVDMVNPFTKKSWCQNETLEQIRERYPGADLMDFQKWIDAKAAKQHTPITWEASTEKRYWEMLEVLPPAAHIRGGFLVGEPMDHDAGNGQPRYSAFRQWGEKFYAASRPMTVTEFKKEMETGVK